MSATPLPTTSSSDIHLAPLLSLPSPALHTVLECLDPLQVLQLLLLSRSSRSVLFEPSLYWKKFGRTPAEGRRAVLEESRLLRVIMERRGDDEGGWNDGRIRTSASRFIQDVQLVRSSSLTPGILLSSLSLSPPSLKTATLALAAFLNPSLRQYVRPALLGELELVRSVALVHSTFGSLSENVRGFRGRDIPQRSAVDVAEILEVLAGGEGTGTTATLASWTRAVEIAGKARPVSSRAPYIEVRVDP